MPTYAKALLGERMNLRAKLTLKQSGANESGTGDCVEKGFRLLLSGD
jgi:hypothetical protein